MRSAAAWAMIMWLTEPSSLSYKSVKRKKGFIYLAMPKVEISSSLVRKRIKENKSIKYLVSKEVRAYVLKNKRRLKRWVR